MEETNPELSIPEIAELANVSETAVRDWFDSGKLRVARTEMRGHQRRRYATKADVDALVTTMQSGGSPAGEATSRPANTEKPRY